MLHAESLLNASVRVLVAAQNLEILVFAHAARASEPRTDVSARFAPSVKIIQLSVRVRVKCSLL